MLPFHHATWITAVAAGLVLLLPQSWWLFAWIVLAIAFALLCAYASLSQTSRLLGPCITSAPGAPPQIALTFDDGPGQPGTDAVLDLLQERGVPATFFLIGHRVHTDPERTRRIHAEGHLIGNHSFRHIPWLPFWPRRALARDIQRCQASIEAATCETPRYYRPPYGLRNHATATAATDHGLQVVGWNCGGLDTTGRSVADLTTRIRKQIQPGAIVLLHDNVADPQRTMALIETVLDIADERGWQTVRLDTLLGLDSPSNAS